MDQPAAGQGGQRGIKTKQCILDRIPGVTRPGVRNHSGRFVDDDESIVLVDDVQWQTLWFNCPRFLLDGCHQLDPLATMNKAARPGSAIIECHLPCFDPGSDPAAAVVGKHFSQDPVQAFTGHGIGYDDLVSGRVGQLRSRNSFYVPVYSARTIARMESANLAVYSHAPRTALDQYRPMNRASTNRPAVAALVCLFAAALTGCGSNEPKPGQQTAAADLYSDAKRDLRIGNYGQAIFDLEEIQVRFPFSEEARLAHLDLIYAYYRNRESDLAVSTADQFIRENPRHPRVDYAYYLRGLVYYPRDRNWLEKLFRKDLTRRSPDESRRSFNYFAVLVDRFPDSPYAEDARERMVFLRNRLAKHELYVARFYMDRRAYLAAAKRALYVVENYPGAPQNKEALEIMIQAYNHLGMTDLASDAQRVLAENFPNS